MQDALFLGGSVSTWGNAPPPSPRENSYQEYMEEWHMRKTLVFTMSLVLLLSFTACNKQQSQQLDTSQPEPEPTVNQVEPEPEQPTVTQLSQTEQKQTEENILQGDELIAIFQEVYNTGKEQVGASDDERLELELSILPIEANRIGGGKQLPADYAEQYIEWRPLADSLDDSAEQAISEGTSSNQTATPTETVQSPSDSGSQAQGTQSQGGETPSSGTPASSIPDDQHMEYDASFLEGLPANVRPEDINYIDPVTGGMSAGGTNLVNGGVS